MQIVYLFSTSLSSGKGGIATAASSFLECLEMAGVQVRVFVAHRPDFGYINNSFLFIYSVFRFLLFILYDCVVCHNFPLLYLHVGPRGSLCRKLLVAKIAVFFNLKVYTHLHSAEFEKYLVERRFWNKLLKSLCATSNVNFVLSDWWKVFYSKQGIYNVIVVPNCLSFSDFKNEVPLIGPKNDNNKVVIFSLGRLVKEKNFQNIIGALKYLDFDTILRIGGDGKYYRELKNCANVYNVGKIEFLGWVDSIQKDFYFKDSDLFVLASSHDSFGLVFIEALSRGCPVVMGPNPPVISALGSLKGVFVSHGYDEISISEAIKSAVKSNIDRNEIMRDCINTFHPKIISLQLVDIFFGNGFQN